MGKGGDLCLVNSTSYDLILGHTHSYQILAWDGAFPATVAAGM
jgi:hypothetical protein